jgi:hypothetical protein
MDGSEKMKDTTAGRLSILIGEHASNKFAWEFACDCAEKVLPLLNNNERLVEALRVTRAFIKGEASREQFLEAQRALGERKEIALCVGEPTNMTIARAVFRAVASAMDNEARQAAFATIWALAWTSARKEGGEGEAPEDLWVKAWENTAKELIDHFEKMKEKEKMRHGTDKRDT